MKRTTPQKQMRTAKTEKMLDNSATETSIAVIIPSVIPWHTLKIKITTVSSKERPKTN